MLLARARLYACAIVALASLGSAHYAYAAQDGGTPQDDDCTGVHVGSPCDPAASGNDVDVDSDPTVVSFTADRVCFLPNSCPDEP